MTEENQHSLVKTLSIKFWKQVVSKSNNTHVHGYTTCTIKTVDFLIKYYISPQICLIDLEIIVLYMYSDVNMYM